MINKKILIVDDSKTARMMSQMILKRQAFDIVFAEDGFKGVEKALKEKPDLILMDVIMPNMNGFEAVEKLKNNDETSSIPVIMVTTRSEAENIEIGYETGCIDYIIKPVSSQELIAKIHNHIGSE